jgi:hypothetical protein
MYGFYEDIVMPLLVIGGLLLALLLGIAAFIAAWDYADCKGFNKGTGIETRWWWGCYANVDYAFGKAHELRLKDKR